MQVDDERHHRVELDELIGTVGRLGHRLGGSTPTHDVVHAVLKVRATAFGGPRHGAAPHSVSRR
jgi:ketopantoate reductase